MITLRLLAARLAGVEMDITLCGGSAFRFYRVPPQILMLYPPLPDPFEDSNHLKLAKSSIVTEVLHTPIHRLIFKPKDLGLTKLYKTRLAKGDLPFGSVFDTDFGFAVTSPAATLLTMARGVSRLDLLMAACEMVGEFAVFNPCERAENLLDQAIDQRFIRPNEGWRRVENVDGNDTNLWRRKPLLTIDELRSFCDDAAGLHGVKDLRWAAERVTGITASPLEVQASLLLGLPRAAGGEGLPIMNNQRIQLSPAARRIYPHNSCYADILIEGEGDAAGVIIECQGRSVHASEAAGISDSNRTTALMTMGYEVILATADQLKDAKSFDSVLDIIAKKANMPRRTKTARQLATQADLRQNLFIDWSTLGD